MSGLFGDLPSAKNTATDAPTAWGAVPKLQPTLRKAPAPLAPPPSVLRAGRGGGRGPPPAGRGAGRGDGMVIDGSTGGPGSLPTSAASTPSASTISLFASVKDEYDPMRPNDFEEVLKARERARKEAEAEAERLAKLRQVEEVVEKLKRDEDGPSAYDSRRAALDMSGEEAWKRRGQMGGQMPPPPPPAPPSGMQGDGMGGIGLGAAGASSGAGLGFGGGAGGGDAGGASGDNGERGMTLAQKLLMKMGWKEGEGLGKNRQGINTPLIMQKVDRRSGVIVNAEPVFGAAGNEEPAGKRQRTGVQIVGTPTRVLCMRNMVGPGEVDEALEDEVGEECSKYGTVTSVLIFEVTTPGYDPAEAVRIFVQFDRPESATKAMVDLQGRFFGGRQIRVAFFSEDRFEATNLAPQEGEFS